MKSPILQLKQLLGEDFRSRNSLNQFKIWHSFFLQLKALKSIEVLSFYLSTYPTFAIHVDTIRNNLSFLINLLWMFHSLNLQFNKQKFFHEIIVSRFCSFLIYPINVVLVKNWYWFTENRGAQKIELEKQDWIKILNLKQIFSFPFKA